MFILGRSYDTFLAYISTLLLSYAFFLTFYSINFIDFLINYKDQNALSNFTLVLLCFLFSLVLHELGHFLIGKLFGFQFLGSTVWIISIFRNLSLNGKISIKLHFNRLFNFSGLSKMYLNKPDNILVRYSSTFIAGSLSNFLVCIISLSIHNISNNYPSTNNILLLLGFSNLFLAILNLFPISHNGSVLDGAVLYNLFSDSNTKYFIYLNDLDSMGIKPSEFLNLGFYSMVDFTRRNFVTERLKLFHFFSHIDNSDYKMADFIFPDIFSNISLQFKQFLYLFSAFYLAYIKGNIELANEQILKIISTKQFEKFHWNLLKLMITKISVDKEKILKLTTSTLESFNYETGISKMFFEIIKNDLEKLSQ